MCLEYICRDQLLHSQRYSESYETESLSYRIRIIEKLSIELHRHFSRYAYTVIMDDMERFNRYEESFLNSSRIITRSMRSVEFHRDEIGAKEIQNYQYHLLEELIS